MRQVILLMLFAASVAGAQSWPAATVYVRVSEFPERRGTVVSTSGDSVFVRFDSASPVEAMVRSQLEMLRTRRHPILGAIVGGVSLALVGARVGKPLDHSCGTSGSTGITRCEYADDAQNTLRIVGAVLGAGAGALIGRAIKTERWIPLVR